MKKKANSGWKEKRAKKTSATIKNRQDAVKTQFLQKLEEMPITQIAASACGIHRSTYYDWRKVDPVFERNADEARKKGVAFINDMSESMLIKSIKNGHMTAIIFWLKIHHPTYVDKRRYEYMHEFKENPLTDERKAQIARAMMAWSEPTGGDERDEDYEPEPYKDPEPVKEIRAANPISVVISHDKPIEKPYVPPKSKTLATYLTPKRRK